MKRIKYFNFFMFWAVASTCKKPYMPPATGSEKSYLVVEGTINTGQDSSIIHLTHTIPLSAPSGVGPSPDLNAIVQVESSANATYPLRETGNGYYVLAGLNLSASGKYRLRITTTTNKTYVSDFVPVKNSKPIDSVGFQAQDTGVQLYVSTHDPSDTSRYYRYEFNETWVIHSDYYTNLLAQKIPKDTIVQRPFADQIYTCWSSDQSSDVILVTTEKLTKDVLVNAPVTFIDSHSEKLGVRYSILVIQHALTRDAFEYYKLLSQNTQNLGGIFDQQPSTLTGNIHCLTNPAEPVIGFITAGSASQLRLYINKSDLPADADYLVNTPFQQCFLDTLYFVDPKTKQNMVDIRIFNGNAIPISPIGLPGQPPLGYTASGGICVDCTLRGSNKPPPFWTNQY
jgi:hypothetical protein